MAPSTTPTSRTRTPVLMHLITEHPDIYYNQQRVLRQNGIVVPPHLYKIIKCNTKDGYAYASAYQFENGEAKFSNKVPLSHHRVRNI